MSPAWRRGLVGLILSQSVGAFTDNAYKMATILLVTGAAGHTGEGAGEKFIVIITVAFLLPFVLFSAVAGPLSDRLGKRSILIGTKMLDVAIFLGAVSAMKAASPEILVGIMFCIGTSHAFSGPAKYGILPQMVPPERLPGANGLVELCTFVAIIMGTIAGAFGIQQFRATPAVIAFALSFVSLAGAACGALVPELPPLRTSSNVLGEMAEHFRIIARSRTLRLTVAGIAFFWFVAVIFQNNATPYAIQVMNLGEARTGLLLASVAIGIGVGSAVAGLVSGRKVELGLVPLGSFGMGVFALCLIWSHFSFALTSSVLFCLGFAGGFFLVPLLSLLQQEAPENGKGGMIAANNIIVFSAMLIATIGYYFLSVAFRLSPPAVFAVAGVVTLLATLYVVSILPEALARLVLWFATRTLYRLTVIGRENIPDRTGALLVCNHVSYVDGFLVLASIRRFIRFIVFKNFADAPGLNLLGRLMRIIPIAADQGPKGLLRSLQVASEALNNGELVCIFAEGEISRTGTMLPFRSGMERILKHAPVPIIPVHLDGVWGSIFSRSGGRFFFKKPKQIPYPVTISFGKPLPHTASPPEVRAAIQELGTEAFMARKKKSKSLGDQFVETSRRLSRRFAAGDLSGAKITKGQLLAKAAFIARAMREHWKGQERVGLLLPSSVGGFVANCAALLAGKVPVNLNFTSSEESLRSAAKQTGLTSILTSKAFLEKMPLPEVAPFVFLEDVAATATTGKKLAAGLAARFLPASLLASWAGREKKPGPDDTAAIIFSSGSTGEPKGVELTHFNLTSNLQSLCQIYDVGPNDVILGILPFFHSFGFMATLALPACVGPGAAFHPNPLDARAVGMLCRQFGGTYLLATPTFLQSFTRRCEPGDFGSLKHAIVGAEKLSDRVAQAFKDRFGLEPLEGYGATECSPLVAVNSPDYRAKGFRQVGAKRGTIGQPVPGVSVRIVNLETGEPVPVGSEGLLLVRGPNVMKGYIGKPEETAKVLKDGWYRTGDMAKIDDEGFLSITDRLNRFSKIGGEMVPHIKIEEALHLAIGAVEQKLIVTAVPDEKKGERLVVLHILEDARIVVDKVNSLGLPNLWLPREDHFFRIDAIPVLGSGKADLRKAKDLARWHLAKAGLL